MGTDEGKTWLSYAEAAKRVRSSGRTVRNWRRQGMPMSWRVDEVGQRYRVVELQVLLAWWREKMQASPVHFYRQRAKAIERGETPPPIPERFRYTAERRQDTRSDASQVTTLPEYPDDAVHGTDASTHAENSTPVRVIDPLADMPTLRGGAEYYALTEKLKDATPGCAGVDEFTADRVDDETAAILADICAHCPMLARCGAFATASRPTAGFWAGQTWRTYDERSAALPGRGPVLAGGEFIERYA
ncbi:WhiB family transcriptional regulator [Microbacterium sp. NPDC089320]|uniref:WhiB family transcriptional regulator n=1 Tax=Microbacterium sp. NPDC089320 TaxID=3155182 RepID=UPI0034475780